MTDYVPPKVWKWEQPSGGQFANINRPVAGATHDEELPVGKHPFQLYSLATPNGQKVSIMFEELLENGHKDAEYDAWPIRIGDGDQFGSGFVDDQPQFQDPGAGRSQRPEPVRVFESGAILVHLAEKFGEFLPPQARSAPKRYPGCSGRWAARPSSAAASAISSPMRRRNSNIRSTATRWRRSGSSTSSTAASRTTNISPGRLFDRRHRDLALVRRRCARPHLRRRRRVPGDP